MKGIEMGRLGLWLFLMGLGTLHAQQKDFVPGMRAPDLHLSKWLSGDPLSRFEPGMVYLLEFTHVYCKPCRQSIPHLTDIQKRYGSRVRVISLYSYYKDHEYREDTYIGLIRGLQKMMGSQMAFSITLDTEERDSYKGWPVSGGFPQVCIIDQLGTRVWRGHGADFAEADEVLGSVVQGTFSVENGARDEIAFRKVLDSLLKRNLVKPQELVSQSNELLERFPAKAETIQFLVFQCLVQHNQVAASAYVSQMKQVFAGFSEILVDFANPGFLQLDMPTGLQLADTLIKMSDDKLVLSELWINKARIFAKMGRFKDAGEAAEKSQSLRDEVPGLLPAEKDLNRNSVVAYEWLALVQRDHKRGEAQLLERMADKSLSLASCNAMLFLPSTPFSSPMLERLKAYKEDLVKSLR